MDLRRGFGPFGELLSFPGSFPVYMLLNFCLIFSCNLSHINLILSLAGVEEGCLTLSDNSNKPILKLINDLGIHDKVVLTGVVAASEMPQILKNASILALDRPDNIQARYGFPTKLGEYLLSENPVVVTHVGDIPLFLKDSVNAYIAEPCNPKAFAEKLTEAFEYKEKASVVGLNGAATAKEHFSNEIETEKMVKIMGLC